MSQSEICRQRRWFLKNASTFTIAIPVASVIGSRTAFAADTPMVDEKSGQGMALKYVVLSTTVGQACENCALYQLVGEADGAGTCALFQGSHVADTAWCSAYSPKG
ncbi:MAG: hypothetical protein ACI8VW_001707 [bacterium]|jgi:hypothetical protein